MTNLEVSKILRKIAAAYIIKDENKYRFQIIAYQRAADSVEHLSSEIKDYWDENKLETVPGVGKTIASQLDELFRLGKIRTINNITKGIPENTFFLLDVPGFGPKTAYKIIKLLHLGKTKTILKDIIRAGKEHKIAKLAGFGEKSETELLEGIEKFQKGNTKNDRILLSDAEIIAGDVVLYLQEGEEDLQIEVLGSLRRKVTTIGDIDIAIATKNPKNILTKFVKYPKTQKIVEKGDKTASIIVFGGRQVDLMTIDPDSFGSLLQHFTGSKKHNIHLRELGLSKSFSLSEYGIKIGGKLRKFDNEVAFYQTLGLEWIPPELREDTGEIKAAQESQLPKLVEVVDIKGDLQIHTDYNIEPSHDLGSSSMLEIVNMAKDLNYEYIAFSDHNPSKAKHSEKQVMSILISRNNQIEQIKKATKYTHIFKLLEVDIDPLGGLAISSKAISKLDAIIVSIHSSMNMSKEEMTKRILKGLQNPRAKILAHPTGRILGNREGYEANWDIIFDFCKDNNKAIEINAFPNRLDLPDYLIREAVKKGVELIIDTDAHMVDHMKYLHYGVSQARRGWATKENIINTLNYKKFKEWLLEGR